MSINTEAAATSADLIAHPSNKPPSANPFAQSACITLSVPDSVEVKLVDASALADYEVWIFLTSILSSAVTGFLVAVVQSPDTGRGQYIAITVVFLLLAVVCAYMAFSKRRKLTSKARRVRFRVGDAMPEDTRGEGGMYPCGD
jgi:VIT1/CCC1 family predicted Fe2+/Mn2+ transporter